MVIFKGNNKQKQGKFRNGLKTVVKGDILKKKNFVIFREKTS